MSGMAINLQRFFQLRKQFCQHEHGCIYDALRYTIKNVKYGLIISCILQLIRSLRALSTSFKKFKFSFRPQYFTLTIYMASTVLILRMVKCSLSWIRNKDDGMNSFAAGLAAGWFGTKTLSKDYWSIFFMFGGSRLLGVLYKVLIKLRYLDETNKQWHLFLMFFSTHLINSIGYFMQPYLLDDDIYNVYDKMSALTTGEKKWHLNQLKYYQRQVQKNYGEMAEFDVKTQRKIRNLASSIKKDEQT